MKTIQGNLDGKGLKIGIIVSRFNDFITDKLLSGALEALKMHGVSDASIEVVKIPGAFEMGTVIQKMSKSKKYNALVCLGAVIRGATSHYDFVAGESIRKVAQSSYDTGMPCSLGIITTENIEQAIERAGSKQGNKGYEAAQVAIEMANLMRILKTK
jgi:6,7-dimethyl-8-ribityllumazine synthase